MAQESLQIRLLQPGEEDALQVFREQVYDFLPVKQTRSHWMWQYAQNPQVDSTGYLTLVCWDGDQIVGQRPLMPFRLWVKGKPVNAVWAPDFMVHPGYRGKGVGSRLYGTALRLNYVYVAANSEKATLHIYHKAGATRLPDLISFIYPHSIQQFLAKRWRLLFGLSVAQRLGEWLLSVRRWTYSVRSRRDERFDIVDLDWRDYRLDGLWTASKLDSLVVAERSVEFMRWRLGGYANGLYQTVAAAAGGDLVGYVVWRSLSPGRFLVVDAWSTAMRPDVLRALMGEMLRRNQSQIGSEFTQCDAAHSLLVKTLKACGFLASGSKSLVVHPAASSVPADVLAQADTWYVTALDSDLDPVFQYGRSML